MTLTYEDVKAQLRYFRVMHVEFLNNGRTTIVCKTIRQQAFIIDFYGDCQQKNHSVRSADMSGLTYFNTVMDLSRFKDITTYSSKEGYNNYIPSFLPVEIVANLVFQ